MKQPSGPVRKPAEIVLKDIRRATRRQFLAEEKIRIVLEGLRNWAPYVVGDGLLITGQNAASSGPTATRLKEYFVHA